MKKTINTEALAVPAAAANLSRYLQLALLVLAAGGIYPMLYLRQVYQSTMLEALAISNSELGYLYSILGTAFLVSYLPSGWLADRLSPRLLISFSLVATGLLGVWYAQLPGFESLLAIFCGFGITTGLTFWASLIKRVKMIAGEAEQGRFFGVLDGGRGLVEALLATVAIALFAQVADDNAGSALGLTRVIHFYAACCVVLGLLLVLVRDPQGKARDGSPREKANLLHDLRTLAAIPELWLVTAIVFCGYHFFWATYSFSAYLQEGGFGLSATAAGLITTLKLWMRPLGGIGGGWLGDRYSKVGVLAWAMVLAALGMIGLIVLPSLRALGVLVFLVIFIGLMTYAIRGLYWAILDDCQVPLRVTGLAIGIISLVGYSPDVFLPLLNGWIIDRFPGFLGYQIYFSYVVAMGLLGVVATLVLNRRIQAKAGKA
ncbi:MFS transporter [Pseudomonas guariconensis]|uniref:MFS transporter n=1 Tax=Pseudomonas TaxID=286 RepID=UPI001CE3C265|nr:MULTISPECIES: MFS transporter [Pseudomonas]MCO7640090.1 MFS transporter [Pseudomonas sp. S 311-6]MCO7514485.1 MFS transporter [Pseudomonas putida]MCO7565449.1 MFS transporter [Pseudomonas mosselii]MCO7595685.1 MFS transporter [Pseudomonas guariconensis]MCO7604538.1 MFS transporter [Pseudomonas guariconensis]